MFATSRVIKASGIVRNIRKLSGHSAEEAKREVDRWQIISIGKFCGLRAKSHSILIRPNANKYTDIIAMRRSRCIFSGSDCVCIGD